MPQGIALTVGLNSVDPNHYGGWSGPLNACEADAEDMAAIARARDFKPTILLTKQATRDSVRGGILEGAKSLSSGDIFLLCYSGHGGQLPDLDGDDPDSMDETWCLYDGELVDDEIYALLGEFKGGVRIFVTSDSCHSGTVTKLAYYERTVPTRTLHTASGEVRYRALPPNVALRTYRNNRAFYDKILRDPKLKDSKASIKASTLLISGCQDNQLSADGDFNGLFTAQLLRVWNNGSFEDTYPAFHREIVKRMPPDQTPNYFRVGPTDPKFEGQVPFTVSDGKK